MGSWCHGVSRERRAPRWRGSPPGAAAGGVAPGSGVADGGAADAGAPAAGADAGAGDIGAAAAAGPDWRTVTLAPLRSLSAPSTTTRSPGDRPALTATRSPLLTPSVTGLTATVLSELTR